MMKKNVLLVILLTALLPQLSWADGEYGLTLYLSNGNDIAVTADNRADVLNDGGSVQFDGHKRLVLNGASLAYITSTLADGLEVYLIGQNTFRDVFHCMKSNTANSVPLTFSTNSSDPGSLTFIKNSSTLEAVEGAFPGFETPVYQDNLVGVLTKSASRDLVDVYVPLSPIVTEEGVSQTVDYANTPELTAETILANETIDGILYTLSDDGSTSSDGYDQANGLVVLNTTQSDADVADVHALVEAQTLVPGTEAYAAAYKGLTFVVPAGEGTITLDTQNGDGFAFHLMIGNGEPVAVVNKADNGGNACEIPYAVSKATYCYLYLVSTSDAAPAYDPRRAGPKSTISGGLSGLSIGSSLINNPPSASITYCRLEASDIVRSIGSRGIRITNNRITDLPATNLFLSLSSPAFGPRRTSSAEDITFIDLTATQITGKHYSRTSDGPFKDLPATTFIYLPAGNTATGPNFVIGGICDDVQLDASSENTFEVSRTFTASKAALSRTFDGGDGQCYTVFLPYALKTSSVGGTFYEYDGYDDATRTARLKVVTGATLTANTAYVYQPDATGILPLTTAVKVEKATASSAPGGSTEADGLHGVYETYEWTEAPTDIFGYSATASGSITVGEFVRVGSGTHIKPFRAYLRISSVAAPERVAIDWGDGTTSVAPLAADSVREDGEGWYTISGFRLPSRPTAKGIYIRRGHHPKGMTKYVLNNNQPH